MISSSTEMMLQMMNAVNCVEPEPCMKVASTPGLNKNLLNMETGKHQPKLADYLFDPKELRRVAIETRVFTRVGFAQGLVQKNPTCSTDACWLPEKQF